ncbi:hypothetical protein FRC03_007270 [Tulasnella sp. 419]|nr:hypothetical protein FRC03_007270 [Tulasnella sp. 419]
MWKSLIVAALASAGIAGANTLVPLWGQCGGMLYTGPLQCEPPNVCVYLNQYYSQCQPPSTLTAKPSTTSTSSASASSGCTDQGPGKCSSSISTTTKGSPASSSIPTKPPPSSSISSLNTNLSVRGVTTTKPTSTLCTHPIPRPTKLTAIYVCHPLYPIDKVIDSPVSIQTFDQSPIGGSPISSFQVAKSTADNSAYLAQYGLQAQLWEYITNSATGSYLRYKQYDPCNPRYWYFSLSNTVTTASYKRVVWSLTQPTTSEVTWLVSPGSVISTSSSSPFGSTSTFLACGPGYELYLQTGVDLPPGVTCIQTTLMLQV